MSEWLGFFEPAQVQTEAQMRSTVQDVHSTIVELGSKDEKMQREAIVHFLNRLHDNILAAQSSPKSKLMSLLMLRQLSQKGMRSERKEDKNSKLFSLLMTSKMFKHLTYLCETVDPRKPMADKGKSFFTSDSAVGNDFIRLILELLKFWADRYPLTKNRQPTAYKRAYDSLLDAKVIFPSEYKFFTALPSARKDKREEEPAQSAPVPPKTTKAGKTDSTRSNPKADVNFMHNRLQNFLQVLDQDDISLIDTEIRTVHALIEKQYPKFERMSEEIIDCNDEQVIHKYFNIRELMQKQLEFHARYIDNNKDFSSYITEVKLEAEKIFPINSSSTPQPPENKYKKGDAPNLPLKDRYPGLQIPQTIKGGNASNITKKIPVSSSTPTGKSNNAPVRQTAIDPAALTAVSNYFTRLEQRSKSPIAGFKKINESLSKQKANTLTSAVKRSISPLTRSKNSNNKSMASLKQSKVAPIFTNPPNPSPPRKQYEGKQIRENFALSDSLRSINKSQGVRRFKTANFKGKSSLFQNEHIQIGYKSQPIYEEVSGFKALMKIELFFGNLGEETIKGVSLEFKGDPNVLLYANPKVISNILPKSEQSRLELIVIPIKAPFPLLAMNLTYQFGGQQQEYKVIIPNSMLKLTHFLDISKSEFQNRWTACELHRTDAFKLCHYLAPDTFKKWFPALGELTSYTTFASPGSSQDYELYCSVIMMQRYEGLLKINIRPNLDVVVQLGIEDQNEQSVSYFLFFLETMQQFLAEVE